MAQDVQYGPSQQEHITAKRTPLIHSKALKSSGLEIFVTSLPFLNESCHSEIDVLTGSHYLLHPHSLTIFEDNVYWTDRQLNRVFSAHKFRGDSETVVSHLVSQPLSIHVHHPVLQRRHHNLMVMKGGHIIDISLKSEEQKASRFLTPIIGVENGLQLDYDPNKECIFWVEAVTKDSENGTIYTMGIGQLDGYLYWLDDGGIAVSAKVGKHF
ncbi:hypothetical protein Pmani_021946 [Petrolisthes manimaculis]|uniref:Uncharacterized protein n=1 Tax=Petrolisthes manimaculis TaxID=1843537 RepID=A0AAE1PFE2_9EUCA|nr:hypothetical protein Pmani_021946 [Petrolisthes manimaculis]